MPQVEKFLKSLANTFIGDCMSVARVAAMPATVVCREIHAVSLEIDVSSQMQLERGLNKAQLYSDFLNFKNHFKSSPDRNGKYVYYFLCSIESLPYPRNEELIFKATAFIDAEFDLARKRIGSVMKEFVRGGSVNFLGHTALALSN